MTTRDWPTALALIPHFALLELLPSQTNTEHRDMPRIMDEELLAHLPILSSSNTRNSSLAKYLMGLTTRYSMSGLVAAASFGACRLHREPTEMENASRL
ncbi:hypothetical protein FPCIR_5327 [Fusarium pseudocircinatum]|uniref:Uncharacterized protein n=1 Tax=Fusarium pseudocircinatum TaxID=56676 RepID=A0A8H5PAV3_9HYPO|nr:hypothetical protein FPCIR_5327 [Fusarium pseudocircinatum]